MPCSNWINFKERLLMLLDVYDLKDVVVNSLPSGSDGTPSTTDLTRDKQARNAILASVADTDLVSGCVTANAMWAKLTGRFEAHSLAQEMYLRDQLMLCKFTVGHSLDDHINTMMSIRKELKLMGAGSEMDDTYMAKRLIQSMPYDHFSTVIDALDESNLNLDAVRLKFHSRNSRLISARQADVHSCSSCCFCEFWLKEYFSVHCYTLRSLS
jgi:hypothetical protein